MFLTKEQRAALAEQERIAKEAEAKKKAEEDRAAREQFLEALKMEQRREREVPSHIIDLLTYARICITCN